MKKLILILLLCANVFHVNAEEVNISVGPAYSTDVWFKLTSGIVKSEPRDTWDIAFQTGQNAGIMINESNNVEAWLVKNKEANDITNELDTSNVWLDWTSLNNSAETWNVGAFNNGLDGFVENGDFGWGVYDMTDHSVIGDNLYLVKLGNGEFIQLTIASLVGGTYSIITSNLKGENYKESDISKSAYSNKNYIYYSISEDLILDREPIKDEWDLQFTKYIKLIDMGGTIYPYGVQGIKTNSNLLVSEINDVEIDDVKTPVFSEENFTRAITTIGDDWKTFNLDDYKYYITEDQSFIITRDAFEKEKPTFFHLYFSSFGGSSTGDIDFVLVNLSTSSVETNNKNLQISIVNQVLSSNEKTLIINSTDHLVNTKVSVYSVIGQNVYDQNINIIPGQNIIQINNNSELKGIYLLKVQTESTSYTERVLFN